GFLIQKAWINIILFIIALIIIFFGIYLNTKPEWIKRNDIKLYNTGVSSSLLPSEILPETSERPSEFPVIRAAAYFNKAATESKDDSVKALALYNLGTLMGMDALSSISGNTPWFALEDAISKLEQSVRLDPTNEDAKYNLELFQGLRSEAENLALTDDILALGWVDSPGYFIGNLDKGY
ncbi:MAG: hypothetical protein ACOWWR_01235, partial [Eubacteriales bacterium]